MVQPDVACEELQDSGELQVGAAVQRRVGEAPAVVTLPVHALELMLDVEKPYPGRARQHRAGELHEQHGRPSEQHAQATYQGDECDVGSKDLEPEAPAGPGWDQPG